MVKIKKDVVEIRKCGKFYNVFGEDAVILHHLLNYKIVVDKGGTGFPEIAYNKVINSLEDAKISYKVSEKYEILAEKDFKKLNEYKKILKLGLKDLSYEERISKIENKLNKLSEKELDEILEIIENAI